MLKNVNMYSPTFKGTVEYNIEGEKLKKLSRDRLLAVSTKFLNSIKENEFASSIDLFKNTTDDTHSLVMCLTTQEGKPSVRVTHSLSSTNKTFLYTIDEFSRRVSFLIPKILKKCPQHQIVNGLEKTLNAIK